MLLLCRVDIHQIVDNQYFPDAMKPFLLTSKDGARYLPAPIHRLGIGMGLLVLVATALLSGCQNDDGKSKPIGTVKIGAIYPLTGHSQSAGEDIQAAIRLAETLINDSFELALPLAKPEGLPGLGGANVEVVIVDSQSNETQAAKLVERLVDEQGVVALMGCYNSPVTAAAGEQAEILRIPFLNANSTSPVLTQRGLQWFFRTTPDDTMFAENFFTFLSQLSQQPGYTVPKRITLVYENRLWGTGVARAERKLADRFGYEVVEDVTYDAQADGFEEELRRIHTAMPGIILQSSYAKDAVAFVEGYKAWAINPVAILAMDAGFVSPTFLETVGRDAEGVFSREAWALDVSEKKPMVSTVNALFRRRHGRNMTGNSARAFTGLVVLADAINRAGSTKADKIRKALLDTHIPGTDLIMPWDGVRFDPDTGQNVLGKGLIVQLQKGEYVTVWPESLSTNPIRWPKPPWSETSAE